MISFPSGRKLARYRGFVYYGRGRRILYERGTYYRFMHRHEAISVSHRRGKDCTRFTEVGQSDHNFPSNILLLVVYVYVYSRFIIETWKLLWLLSLNVSTSILSQTR